MKRALLAVLVLVGGCTPSFEDESTVKDLRVLGVTAEPPEILFEGGPLSQQPELCPREDVLRGLIAEVMMNLPSEPRMLMLRPLVIDPRGGGRPVHYRAVACVSPVNPHDHVGGGGNMMPGGVRQTIGRGACPDNAPLLGEGDVTPVAGSLSPDIQVPLVLTRELLLSAASADLLGMIYGLALTVQVTVSAGEEQVIARKRVLINVRLSADHVPNKNPLIAGVSWRKTKEDMLTPWDMVNPPTVRLGESLRVEPAPGDKESYPTRIGDRNTGCVSIQQSTEALRFAFFASSGTFGPGSTNTEPPVFRDPGTDPHRLETTYDAPKELLPGESDLVRLWIVTRDERAGSSFIELPLRLVP